MLATMTVVYSVLGLYLDQVIQMEYGIAKPWNFLCVSAKTKKKKSQVGPLSDDDIPKNKKMENFERISE